MTEEEWLTITDPVSLLKFAWGTLSDRRYRLYLCGGCRHIEADLYSPLSVEALDIMERAVDGLATDYEEVSANGRAESPTFGFDFEADFWNRHPAADRTPLQELIRRRAIPEAVLTAGEWQVDHAIQRRLMAAAELVYTTTIAFNRGEREPDRIASHISAVNWPGRWLVDCIVGNPFRPVAFDLRWRSETAVALAAGIYAERAFDRLPILADALEEAGCDHADLLAHCRDPHQPHARGCWVVDLVLNKS